MQNIYKAQIQGDDIFTHSFVQVFLCLVIPKYLFYIKETRSLHSRRVVCGIKAYKSCAAHSKTGLNRITCSS